MHNQKGNAASELRKASVKSKVEAILFSVGHRINLDEISKLCRSKKEDVIPALHDLKNEYNLKESSLALVDDGDFWNFTVRDAYMPIVRKIVTETELTKSVIETLAVIAFKYPLLQSDLIRIRTNKAYEHLMELEKLGYITRQKQGRTNLIKLTDKFFRYFDLTKENLKEHLKDFESIAKAIKEKEKEADLAKDMQKKMAEDLKKEDERIKNQIDSLDSSGEDFAIPLQTYEVKQNDLEKAIVQDGNLIVKNEMIGDMKIVENVAEDMAKEEDTNPKDQNDIKPQATAKYQIAQAPHQPSDAKSEDHRVESLSDSSKDDNEDSQDTIAQEAQVESEENTKGGIKVTPEMEAKAEQMVQNMLKGKKSDDEKD